MMKIFYFINNLQRGGKERQLVELLTILSKVMKINCILVLLTSKVEYPEIFNLDINIEFLDADKNGYIKTFRNFYKLIKKNNPDVVQSYIGICSLFVTLVRPFQKFVFIENSVRSAPPRKVFSLKKKLIDTINFYCADVVISNSFAGLLSYNVPKNKAKVINNCFDIQRITYVNNKIDLKEKINIPRHSKIIGMVANFNNNKDYETYLSTAIKILNYRNDVCFITIGNGKNSDMFRLKFDHPKIKYLGYQENVEEYINIFDIGVLLTNTEFHGEGISNSILEYMAFEKPVIATGCGGNNEIIKDGWSGILIASKDSIGLENKINYLLDNKNEADKLGRNGKKILIEKFNCREIAEEYISTYKKLITNKRK